jgi:hypothetical protein
MTHFPNNRAGDRMLQSGGPPFAIFAKGRFFSSPAESQTADLSNEVGRSSALLNICVVLINIPVVLKSGGRTTVSSSCPS